MMKQFSLIFSKALSTYYHTLNSIFPSEVETIETKLVTSNEQGRLGAIVKELTFCTLY